MNNYFQSEGRALLAKGYLIVPIKPGEKRPALVSWQKARLGVADLSRYARCGVGVLTGQGAHPIAAIDIDCHDKALSRRFADWCQENLGITSERVGFAPKLLLPYRAAEDKWGKAFSATFTDLFGDTNRVEVLGYGQQFVAYHVHPEAKKPYEWFAGSEDFGVGGLSNIRADSLPVVTEEQIVEAIAAFETMAREQGLELSACRTCSDMLEAPKNRTPRDEEDFYGRTNEAAMQNLAAWVPALLPSAREYHDGYRVAQVDLGRQLEEDLSILPVGIVDFGVADQGDPRDGKRTPIDLVLEWAPLTHDFGELDTPFEAATWLCEQLGTPREDLGYGLRRQREKTADRDAKLLILGGVRERVQKAEDTVTLLGEATDFAREILETNPELRAEIAGLIRSRYKELSGFSLPASDLNHALAKAHAPTVQSHRPLTEFGNADRMLDRYGEGLMYVPEMAGWYSWTGVYWRRAHDVELEHCARETVRALVHEINNHPDQAEFYKFCALSQQARMAKNMVSLAMSDPRVVVPAEELDKYKDYLGVQNGIVHLPTGKLMDPDPDYRITFTAGCDYNPKAKCPIFMQTLREVFFGDETMVSFMQRLMGYIACGDPKEHLLIFPFGVGANGKSTIFNAVRRALGAYARTADAASFVSEGRAAGGTGGPREDLLRLKGARFVFASEPDENSELREGTVKSMTGGDAIIARGLYSRSSIEVLPTWTVVMPTNHKPIIKGSDHGIWRRLMLIPFTRNFDLDTSIEKDPDRAEKLDAECEGILAWVVEGARAYLAGGLQPPAAVQQAREEYREQMDLLAEWLDECCEVGPSYEAKSSELWASWERYAREHGTLNYIRNSKAFGRRLDSRFPTKKGTNGVRMRENLRLKTDGGFFPED